jgi:hypothetical protein
MKRGDYRVNRDLVGVLKRSERPGNGRMYRSERPRVLSSLPLGLLGEATQDPKSWGRVLVHRSWRKNIEHSGARWDFGV